MKRIEAFIQPHRLAKVVSALHALPAFPGFTILDAHGQGHGRGAGGHFAYESNEGLLYHKRLCLLIICENGEATAVATAVAKAAHTGKSGDGLIAISDIRQVLRIRDGGEHQ